MTATIGAARRNRRRASKGTSGCRGHLVVLSRVKGCGQRGSRRRQDCTGEFGLRHRSKTTCTSPRTCPSSARKGKVVGTIGEFKAVGRAPLCEASCPGPPDVSLETVSRRHRAARGSRLRQVGAGSFSALKRASVLASNQGGRKGERARVARQKTPLPSLSFFGPRENKNTHWDGTS